MKEDKIQTIEYLIFIWLIIPYVILTLFYIDLINIYNCFVTYNYGVWVCNSQEINEIWILMSLYMFYFAIKQIYYISKDMLKEIINKR